MESASTMILTPIKRADLTVVIDLLDANLSEAWSKAILRRIAESCDGERSTGLRAASDHKAAMGVLTSLGMTTHPGAPSQDFSCDGRTVRCGTEAYVLLHEAAHFQLATPSRRYCIDFGLGPGPETGKREEAGRAALLFGLAREREEAKASLLGILWEVELGQPALASFLDQNWLEGPERPGTAAHFEAVLDALYIDGFITTAGRPTRRLRVTEETGG
jgi:hypothetical protein